MNRTILSVTSLFLVLLSVPAAAQHHMSNWVYRNATDTTIVRCWTDSLTVMGIAPNSMSMMMMPDSMYMRIDLMNMDSLHIPHDSTFIGWCRVQAGRDSMYFDMMNGDSMYGTHNMMQFMKGVSCQFHWDSLMSDSMHRHWRPTGICGWNGYSWVALGGIGAGNTVSLASSQLYSAFAFVGTPSTATFVSQDGVSRISFRLDQNYPNPFNPNTTISYALPARSQVTLIVFNALGQRVVELVNGAKEAGYHLVRFDGSGLASGVYFYRLSVSPLARRDLVTTERDGQAGNSVQTKKLLLLR